MSDTLERMKAAVEQLNNSNEGDDVKDAIKEMEEKGIPWTIKKKN